MTARADILLCPLPEYPDEALTARLTALLPEFRRRKALSYKLLPARMQCAVSFLLLQAALRPLGFTEIPEFVYGTQKKPYLPGNPVYFNLSHCKKAAVCAVSPNETGIDAECCVAWDPRLAERICAAGEAERLAAAEDPGKALTLLWTQKEAISKFDGRGFRMGFRSIRPDRWQTLSMPDNGEGYCITLCTGKAGMPLPDVRFCRFASPEDLICGRTPEFSPLCRPLQENTPAP